jgi:hypothetical protein
VTFQVDSSSLCGAPAFVVVTAGEMIDEGARE